MNVPFFKLLKEEVSSNLALVLDLEWSEVIFRLKLLLVTVEYPQIMKELSRVL